MPKTKKKKNKKYNSKKNKERCAKYYQKNKEKEKKRIATYNSENPEKAHRTHTISCWRSAGIEDEDFDLLYDVFMAETNCWICGKIFSTKKDYDAKVLDHNHSTGEARYICCRYCNLHVVG